MRTLPLLLLFTLGCATSKGPDRAPPASAPDQRVSGGAGRVDNKAPAARRRLAVSREHSLYQRVEGAGLKNACAGDAECKAGGCSGEVCSAEEGVNTTCEVRSWPQGDALCGCVEGECVWYVKDARGESLPGAGLPCPDGKCAEGLSCLTYYGVAGPRGPAFTSCERPCASAPCPMGQRCVTIADGPGQVCR